MNYAKQTTAYGKTMTLIGSWIDLAAYYAGDDGNAWMYHTSTNSWVNQGELNEFKQRLAAGKFRGKLL